MRTLLEFFHFLFFSVYKYNADIIIFKGRNVGSGDYRRHKAAPIPQPIRIARVRQKAEVEYTRIYGP
jgi:hypothetical protein